MKKNISKTCGDGSGGIFYALGVIGAAVYYVTQATGFWGNVLGLLKALVWPALLVYEVLTFVGA